MVEAKLFKQPLTAAERKQRQRQKLKDIEDGVYQPSLIDAAKSILAKMTNPSVERLMEMEEFKDKLGQQEMQKLGKFIVNMRHRIQSVKKSSEQSLLQQMSMAEKVKRIANSEFADLQKILTMQHTQLER